MSCGNEGCMWRPKTVHRKQANQTDNVRDIDMGARRSIKKVSKKTVDHRLRANSVAQILLGSEAVEG